ncbi:DUF3616 domain-containing protein [Fulvivirgaceae bacterium BMA10]|uniref:DUF3616 domain-containing protein n=1 Tax=Splendidivirga corallicola TaxID=3051826 RepID=A0ABT8KV46_9BACT|nr:DUF3616 domain-containing protein [Fulvivirgaceae bacterium BMA10]
MVNKEIRHIDTLRVEGSLRNHDNISGIVYTKGFIIVGSDEGAEVQIIRKRREDYEVVDQGIAFGSRKDEVDIESIANEGDVYYVLGSHAAKRKKVRPLKKTYAENRKRLTEVVPSGNDRNQLMRFRLGTDGSLKSKIERFDITSILDRDVVLSVFKDIPSKENGIDIEGLAVYEETLFFGFRGPVIRGNYVPILIAKLDNLSNYEIRYINLNGLGVRDMARVENGFLIIAGPVSDMQSSFHIYYWDGEDGIPGNDREFTPAQSLGKIPVPGDSKAEGLTILEETNTHYDVIIVYDGIDLNQLNVYRIEKKFLNF